MDFRHRSDGGPGILGGGFLVDGDRRGKTVNGIHCRFLHLAQKLTGIGGQRFHVTPLSLRIQRIECQRGLAAAGKSGKHDQLVSGQGQIKAFEVILMNALQDDVFLHEFSFAGLTVGRLPELLLSEARI